MKKFRGKGGKRGCKGGGQVDRGAKKKGGLTSTTYKVYQKKNDHKGQKGRKGATENRKGKKKRRKDFKWGGGVEKKKRPQKGGEVVEGRKTSVWEEPKK